MRSLFVMIVLLPLLGVIVCACSSEDKDATIQPSPTRTTPAAYRDINPADAKQLIESTSNLVIVDVSPLYENGHLPGAVNYVMADGTLAKAIPILNSRLPYLVYCHSDSVSLAASQLLIDSGFGDVYRLTGNYAGWVSAGYEVETGRPSLITAEWWPDGVLDEYENMTEPNNDYVLHWTTDDRFLYMGMKAKTDGWVSVGFEPTSRMKDADMILGYITGGKTVIVDMFSTGPLGPHPADTELGGTDDILAFGGIEDGEFTIIEFKRRQVTGDNYDSELGSGTIDILWAFGSGDSLTQRHSNRGSGEIDLR